jgi:predicted acetyltransferase
VGGRQDSNAVIEIRTPGDDDWLAVSRADYRAFGHAPSVEEENRERPLIDLGRYRMAVDRGDVVGVAGSFALQMTLPGGAAVPTGGVTWVSVAVTHRRQGLLRRLMEAVHRDIDDRGEPLAALTASEGGIYERFGYGIASQRRVCSIDRRRAQFQERFRPEPGTVRLVDPLVAADDIAKVWDRFRATRAGEIARTDDWHRVVFADQGPGQIHALHPDGYASWKIEAKWNDGHPAHELWLSTMAPVTPEAHVALWQTVLATDLVGPIRSHAVPPDDPLPFLLTDQRVVRTTDLNDCLWCRVRDVEACFGARTYGTDDDVVVEVDGTRWRIGAGGVRPVRTRPDLVTDAAGLGALVLGGVAPTTLAAGRRLEPRSAEALRRADALFLTHPLPYSQTGF